MTAPTTGSPAKRDPGFAAAPRASGRKSAWWKKHAMDRIARCVPPDCREEVREVLTALDPDNPVAALLFLIREYKVEVLATRAAMVRRAAAPDDAREETSA